MKPGDIVEFLPSGDRGFVRRIDQQVRVAQIQMASSVREEPDDLDTVSPETCRVVVNAPENWPFLKVPDRPRLGPFLRPAVVLPTGPRDLILFHEWLPTGVGSTLSVFLAPELRLRHGMLLHAIHEKGVGRIDIPVGFRTVARRVAEQQKTAVPVEAPQPAEPAFSLLLGNLFDED
jgi:hypothetical protein